MGRMHPPGCGIIKFVVHYTEQMSKHTGVKAWEGGKEGRMEILAVFRLKKGGRQHPFTLADYQHQKTSKPRRHRTEIYASAAEMHLVSLYLNL